MLLHTATLHCECALDTATLPHCAAHCALNTAFWKMVTVCADYAAVVVEEQPLIGDYEGLLRLGRQEGKTSSRPAFSERTSS